MRRKIMSILIGALWAFISSSCTAAFADDRESRRIVESLIGSDLSILVDISETRPYLGQQIAVIYTLRAKRFPLAVDVQPQQFSGFWTEPVPPPEQARTILRVVNGRALREFLLRRVVAYPLLEGGLQFPPLEVKVKTSGSLIPGEENWDLIASSEPVTIQVRPLPPHPTGERIPSLVGTLQGRLTTAGGESTPEFFLDLDGTANIAFFRPEEWVRIRGGSILPPRLLSLERRVEAREAGGWLNPRLSYRQRWSIRVVPDSLAGSAILDLEVPLFDEEKRRWTVARIPSLSSLMKAEFREENADSLAAQMGERTLIRRLAAIALMILAASALAVWRLRRRGFAAENTAKRRDISHRSLSALKKQLHQAPRAFLETAHRILMGYAEDNQLSISAVDAKTLFGRCWGQVQSHRFVEGIPPAETRDEIFQAIQTLLGPPDLRQGRN